MLSESFKIAIHSLRKNLTRTMLTVLGIVIGISSVITVMSAGQGIKGLVLEEVESFGPDLIEIEIKVPSTSKTSAENAVGIATGIEITTLKISDKEAVQNLPNVKNTYAGTIGQEIVSYRGENEQVMLFGTSASFIDIDSIEIEEGRFYTDEEDKSLANVALLGAKVKESLFGQSDYLGKLIQIGKQKFKVIGLMEERGATFGFDMDNMIYVPIRTLQKKIMGINHITFMMAQVENNKIIEQTADEITELIRDRHDITNPDKDDFHATSMAEAIEILDQVFWAITVLLIAVASVSLIVGGVGIMNIMYVSVMERTYEIGLRKSVGASRSDILTQFLWEAVVVTFLGAIIGIITGILLSAIISLAARSQGLNLKFIILPSSLLLASGVSIAIGLIFGIFPALAAAKMDPIKALRYKG